jgi:hypothetical protein
MQARYLYHIFSGAGKIIQEHESLKILYYSHGITEIETFFLSNTFKGPAKGMAEHLSGRVSWLLNKM